MIYTLTFSPAIDYILELENIEVGKINRAKKEVMLPGGKGINVSIVLSNLGRKSIATGFLGGFTGDFIENELNKMNIDSKFIRVEGNTRINVKIRGREETAINGRGPIITNEKIDELVNYLSQLNEDDLLIISGLVPSNLPINIYDLILSKINKDVKLVVDSEKDVLLSTLKYHPLLVKPNKEELEEVFNKKINTFDELVLYARKLKEQGALNVIVSLGEDGALLVTENNDVIKVSSPGKGNKVINTVGSGDSVVAGFVDEYYRSGNVIKAFKWGVACGSSKAYSLGFPTIDEVKELFNEIK